MEMYKFGNIFQEFLHQVQVKHFWLSCIQTLSYNHHIIIRVSRMEAHASLYCRFYLWQKRRGMCYPFKVEKDLMNNWFWIMQMRGWLLDDCKKSEQIILWVTHREFNSLSSLKVSVSSTQPASGILQMSSKNWPWPLYIASWMLSLTGPVREFICIMPDEKAYIKKKSCDLANLRKSFWR